MIFEKKILILSQITDGFSLEKKRATAICRVENESGVSTLFFSAVNFTYKKDGEYFLFIISGDKTLSFPLGNKPTSLTIIPNLFIDINELSAGIVFVKDCFPQVVAFAGDNEEKSLSELKKRVYDKFIIEMKKQKENESDDFVPHFPIQPDFPLPSPFPSTGSPKFPDIDPLNPNNKKEEYDDEVVATENYYDFDSSLNEKLKIIENLTKNVSTENGVPNFFNQEETQKNENQFDTNKNETNKSDCQNQKFGPQNPYFLTKKAELDEIFNKFPKEESLSRAFCSDRWAKITYAKDKFYVVGVIFENQKEKYICYGVPGEYSKNPPKELKGFCSFIPLSVFDLKGKGYWMMFQDAITGKHVQKAN